MGQQLAQPTKQKPKADAVGTMTVGFLGVQMTQKFGSEY